MSEPTIVLVHGAWADASSWNPVTTALLERGHTVLLPPNPLRGLSGDAAYVGAFLAQHTSGPVVLCGHSYGGAVISGAGLAGIDRAAGARRRCVVLASLQRMRPQTHGLFPGAGC